ncbi:G1/S-specific cyclin-D2-like protein, partial [Dinothrombium tinctorium]
VCEELKCDEIVFPLAINYVDRFLSSTSIKKSQLQLLGAVCLLIASKLRQCQAIHSEDLVYYSDHSLSVAEIITWELFVLSRLKWDISSVVATDFVDHLLLRLSFSKDQLINTIRRHTSTFIALCSTGKNFARFKCCLLIENSCSLVIQHASQI